MERAVMLQVRGEVAGVAYVPPKATAADGAQVCWAALGCHTYLMAWGELYGVLCRDLVTTF